MILLELIIDISTTIIYYLSKSIFTKVVKLKWKQDLPYYIIYPNRTQDTLTKHGSVKSAQSTLVPQGVETVDKHHVIATSGDIVQFGRVDSGSDSYGKHLDAGVPRLSRLRPRVRLVPGRRLTVGHHYTHVGHARAVTSAPFEDGVARHLQAAGDVRRVPVPVDVLQQRLQVLQTVVRAQVEVHLGLVAESDDAHAHAVGSSRQVTDETAHERRHLRPLVGGDAS